MYGPFLNMQEDAKLKTHFIMCIDPGTYNHKQLYSIHLHTIITIQSPIINHLQLSHVQILNLENCIGNVQSKKKLKSTCACMGTTHVPYSA